MIYNGSHFNFMSRPLLRDLTGQRFGYLTVIGRGPNRRNKVYWHCRCRCGRETDVQSFDLIFGKVLSCGCYRSQRQKDIHAR